MVSNPQKPMPPDLLDESDMLVSLFIVHLLFDGETGGCDGLKLRFSLVIKFRD